MRSGFEEFVESSSPRLQRTARLLLGSAADSQDLVQELLIVMFRHWGRIDGAAADAYAYKTLVRLVRRHQRRARFRHEQLDLHLVPDTLDHAAPASDRDSDVTDAVAALPPRQREAVVLRFYLDLSVEDTAHAMRCAEGTVKSQVSKALATVERHLDQRTKARER